MFLLLVGKIESENLGQIFRRKVSLGAHRLWALVICFLVTVFWIRTQSSLIGVKAHFFDHTFKAR